MHARVTFLEFDPKDTDDVARLFEEAVGVVHEQEDGYRGALLLVREDGKAMAVNLSESLEHLRTNDRAGLYQAEVAKFRSLIVGHPRREFFRLAVSMGIESAATDD